MKTREGWIDTARRAEDLGYDTFLVPDHFWLDVAPVPALMTAAAATTSIRIGSHVFCNDLRSPAMLAKEVATLDMLSDGRFRFGLGCGYALDDYQQAGIAFDEPKVRIDRMKEALFIIKHYFTDEVVNFCGKYYTVTDLKGSATHVQRPHPPVYIGASGKRMLTIAGCEADIVGIGGGTTEATRQQLAWLREAAGERFDRLELATMVFVVKITDRQKEVVQHVADYFPPELKHLADCFHITPESALGDTRILIGSVDQIVETLLDRRERFGISYIQVAETHFEELAPIVARLAGR